MNDNGSTRLIVICGPTASGKSELAVRLAHEINAEIINADSMQIYRGLTIGTAKPSCQDRAAIRHYLIDIAQPDESFSAADFTRAADAAVREITGRGKRVIVAGGTGLYIKAFLRGLVDSPGSDESLRKALHDDAIRLGNEAMLGKLRLVDPECAAQLHPNNLVRIIRALEVFVLTGRPLSSIQREHTFATRRYDALQIGLTVNRSLLYQRTDLRVEKMMRDGLVAEVESLLAAGYGSDLKPMRSIGYKEVAAHLRGELTLAETVRLIQRDTRHYAKRQMTWFTADSDILWFDYPEKFDTILGTVIQFYAQGER